MGHYGASRSTSIPILTVGTAMGPMIERRSPRGRAPAVPPALLAAPQFALLLIALTALPQSAISAQELRGGQQPPMARGRPPPSNASMAGSGAAGGLALAGPGFMPIPGIPVSSGPCAALRFRMFRLPDHVAPTAYRLDLDVMLKAPFRVVGRLEIDLNVSNGTRCVALNSMATTITSVKVKDPEIPGPPSGLFAAHPTPFEALTVFASLPRRH